MELEQRQSSTDHPIILNGPRRMDTIGPQSDRNLQ